MTRTQKLARRTAAAICLIAVLLFYAPYAGAAWYTTQHLCCANGLCEVHGHKHEMAKSADEMPMDCGHGLSQISGCKMSCCKTAEQVAVGSQAFVMPRFQIAVELRAGDPQIPQSKPQMISRYDKPQSPPPRFSAA